MVSYAFHNGAKLSIVAINEKSRGIRKTGGLVEEVITVDQKLFSEVVVPMMNVSRVLPDGSKFDTDVVNKSQVYVTSAGYKNSFAYDKLIFLLIKSVLDPNSSMIMGGTYKIPIKEGLLDADFVKTLQEDPTFNMDSFDREYGSEWSGSYDGSLYNPANIEEAMIIKKPEQMASTNRKVPFYYIFSLDFGRYDCSTELCVWKVYPQEDSESIKSLVNIFSFENENATFQAVSLHELYEKFRPEVIVIDANGNGVALLDVLVLPFTDPRTGRKYESWGLINDEKNHYTNKYIDKPRMIIYQVKGNTEINSIAYNHVKDQFRLGKVRLLMSEKDASNRLELTATGRRMEVYEKKKFLRPYALTDGLKDQILNLYDVNAEKINAPVVIDKINSNIYTDRFMALAYGIYYICEKERKEGFNTNRNFSVTDLLCF